MRCASGEPECICGNGIGNEIGIQGGNEILQRLINNTKLIDVNGKFLRLCKSYFPEDELIDIYHAATCLQESAVLITNDRHFDKIHNEKIIEAWSISRAIKEFGI